MHVVPLISLMEDQEFLNLNFHGISESYVGDWSEQQLQDILDIKSIDTCSTSQSLVHPGYSHALNPLLN